MDKLNKNDLLLLVLYMVMVAIILFRINVEATGYTTFDSVAYLDLAQNLKDGHGFYVLNTKSTAREYFATWPVGYPVLIYLFSKVSHLNVYWSSKALNFLLLGGGFLLLRRINRPYAFLLAAVYGAYTFMEIYSSTWSEAPFLLLLLLLAYVASQAWQEPNSNKNIIIIFLTCLALFLTRYIGAFSFGVPALLGLYLGYKRQYAVAAKFFGVSLVLALLAAAYLYNNYYLSGFITGVRRFETENALDKSFKLFILGFINELLIIRKLRQPSDILFIATTLLQFLYIATTIFLLRKYRISGRHFVPDKFACTCFIIGTLYLSSLMLLRSTSNTVNLDYRTLSCFSFLLLVGLMSTLAKLPEINKGPIYIKYLTFSFFLLSLLLSLPKQYLLMKLTKLL